MRKLLLIIPILIPSLCLADIHYVSKTGTSEHPFTSWETAADSVQKAIDAAEPWDTVRVGAGTYYETVVMIEGLALLGAGMDSAIIDGSNSTVRDIVSGADSGSIEGFHIKGRYFGGPNPFCNCIYNSVGGNTLKHIKNNKISNCDNGAMAGWGTEGNRNLVF